MKRSTFMTILMVLAFILAGYLIYTRIIQKPPRETVEIVVCKNPTCHYVFEVPAGRGGAPYECPHCREKTAYLAFQCKDAECRAIFPVTPEQMERGEPRCPVCNHQADMLLRIPKDADVLAIKGAAPE